MKKIIAITLVSLWATFPWSGVTGGMAPVQAAAQAPNIKCQMRAPAGTVAWDASLGGVFSGGPAFFKGVSYLGQFDGYTNFFAMKDTGEILAQTDIAYSVESSPAVSRYGQTVYTNTVNLNGTDMPEFLNDGETLAIAGHGTQALDAVTLDLKAAHGGKIQGSDGSPLVSRKYQRIYSATVGIPELNEDVPPALYALNAEDLSVEWEYPVPGWTYSSPVEDQKGNIYFGSEVADSTSDESPFGKAGRVISLDPDGNERWTLDTVSEPAGGPAMYVKKGKTFLIVRTMDGEVMKIDAVTGAQEWSFDSDAAGFSAPVLGANNASVYVTTNVNQFAQDNQYLMKLIALSEKTGEVLWTYAFDNESATPVVGTSGVYVVSKTGTVIAVSESGEEMWQVDIGHPVYYGYIGMNACGQLQIPTADGHLVAVGTESKGMNRSSDWPTYRGDYGRTGFMF